MKNIGKDKKHQVLMGGDINFEPIKQRIRSECPNAEISMLASSRDNVGGVLYVRNVPTELVSRIRVSVNYVMVQLDDQAATDLLIVPIIEPELTDRTRAYTAAV
jgi:hypothetical protein